MLAWLAASAWAGAIQDPAAWIDPGGGSLPFTGLGSFSPAQDGGIIALYNDTGLLLTSISLSTTGISTGLSQATISADFNCNDLKSGFFLDCAISYFTGTLVSPENGAYIPGTAMLTISFSGVVPYVAPASFASSDLVGDDMGIPPLPPGCILTPDAEGCTDIGHFKFNFLNLDAPPSDDNGNGWAAGDESLFPDGTPTFAPPAYTDDPIPEPGTSALLGAGLLALALLSRRNYFSRSSRS